MHFVLGTHRNSSLSVEMQRPFQPAGRAGGGRAAATAQLSTGGRAILLWSYSYFNRPALAERGLELQKSGTFAVGTLRSGPTDSRRFSAQTSSAQALPARL